MSYFPALIKLDGKKVLIVGGGKIATDKLMHMLDFTINITVIARLISVEIKDIAKENNLVLFERSFEMSDLEGFDIVIVAVDDIPLQEKIYQKCQEIGILCNSVDSVAYCDFIFPSYIKEGDLIIAVSTSGSSPAVSKYLRRFLQAKLPSNIPSFLEEMKVLRLTLPKGKARMKLLEEKAKAFFNF